jgi:hypothetical protein
MPMERPKVTQGFLNRLEKPTDMPDLPWVQWRVENVEELGRFIEDHVVNKYNVRARFTRIPGDQVLIQTAVLNSDLQLSPGDCLVLAENENGPRLGVVRARNSVPFREADGLKDHDNPEFLDPRDGKISHGIIN